MENECQRQPLQQNTGKSFSAPARLCPRRPGDSASSKLTSWRFVNKYEHRSNGGIPIFSEERLQERKGVNTREQILFHSMQSMQRKQNTSCISSTNSKVSNCKVLAIYYSLCHLFQLWKPSWPPKLEPIRENHCSSNKGTDKCTHTHLKLPPQLAKYIDEMWNS